MAVQIEDNLVKLDLPSAQAIVPGTDIALDLSSESLMVFGVAE
jgi:hypothetical protein